MSISNDNTPALMFDPDSQDLPENGAGGDEFPNGRHPDAYPKPKSRAKAAPEPAKPQSSPESEPAASQPAPEPVQRTESSEPIIDDVESFVTDPGAGPVVDDPFSPENLAISQDFGGMTETKRLLTLVKVGRPHKESFVRTSKTPNHWITGSVLELKNDGDETYWVTPSIRDALNGEPCLKYVRLILAVDRHGNPFFWKIGMPDPDRRTQPWIDSALQAAQEAQTRWVRISWNRATSAYETTVSTIQAEPQWPTESIRELLNIAFRGRIVSSLDHPVIRTLKGLE